jgi:asparagine N-glycosylation enzyme membrane subunit Stt3
MNLKLKIIFLIVIGATAFHFRFTHGYLRSVNTGVTFITPDPYYHLRRIVLTAQDYPNLPSFDYYLSYPTGAHCIWPPLFDFGCASLAYTIGLGNPSIDLTESIAAIYPILFALIVIILTYLIGKEVFNDYVGIIGASIVAFLPASVMFSAFGFTDHHIAESFALLLILYFALKQKEELKIIILLGLSIGIALLLWQGSILFAGILFLYMFLSKPIYKYTAIVFILPILMILPFIFGSYYVGGYFTHRSLSLLHIALLGIAGLLMYLKYLIVDRKIYYLTAGFILLVFVLSLLPQIQEALNFVTKNVWTKTIPGYQSVMALMEGYVKTVTVNKMYGRLYFLIPVIIIILVFDKKIKKRFMYTYFLVIIGILSFMVTQYNVWFAPLYALLVSYFLYVIFNLLYKMLHGISRLSMIPIFAIILFISFQPVFNNYYFTFEDTPKKAEYLAYLWLRDSTETTSHFTEPSRKPEYGVMSFYEHGHFIIYISHRPAVANNFGKDAPNFDIPNRFILSQSEEEANEILSEYGVRYIFCTPNANDMILAAKFLDYDIHDYFKSYPAVAKSGEPATILTPMPKAIRSTYHRLYKFYGCGAYFEGGIYIEPIRNSRLVYVSPTDWPIKIFEFVKAAQINGRNKPNSSVLLYVPVNLPNAKFIWSDALTTDKNGNFSFTCPYKTDTAPAIIVSDKDSIKVDISEKNVLNGDTIRVYF